MGWFSVLKVEDGLVLAKWQEGGQLGGCHHRPHKRWERLGRRGKSREVHRWGVDAGSRANRTWDELDVRGRKGSG